MDIELDEAVPARVHRTYTGVSDDEFGIRISDTPFVLPGQFIGYDRPTTWRDAEHDDDRAPARLSETANHDEPDIMVVEDAAGVQRLVGAGPADDRLVLRRPSERVSTIEPARCDIFKLINSSSIIKHYLLLIIGHASYLAAILTA